MAEENRLRFIEAMRDLDGPAILELLPHLTLTDLNVVRQYWHNGHLGQLDPTNVLTAGDFADQFLSLPDYAIALYDAALEFMDKHPESIADDTDCAAASLNLMDLLAKAGQDRAAVAAARRAAGMPVKRAEQNLQIAVGLSQGGDAKTALMLFQRVKASGLSAAATAMGVTVNDLNQMERVLMRAVAVGGD